MSEPKQEYGWRMLDPKTDKIRLGDEYWSNGWLTNGCECAQCQSTFRGGDYTHRRRIDAGEGKEIIPPNETLPAKFEGFNKETQQWQEDGFTGTPRPTAERCFLASRRYLAFRRRKPSDWVKCSERLPEKDRPFWAMGIGHPKPTNYEYGLAAPSALLGSYSHWRYCEGSYQIPPAPIPEQSAADKAWDEVAEVAGQLFTIHSAFIRGFEKGAQSK